MMVILTSLSSFNTNDVFNPSTFYYMCKEYFVVVVVQF
jgi:hypothetical protein